MRILATYNIKGGVGKTTAAVNLGYLAAQDGFRTLLWDLDPQAAATYMFRVRARVKGGGKALIQGTRSLDDAIKGTDFDNLDILPGDFTYRNMDLLLDDAKRPTRRLSRLLGPLADDYDVVVLDCPPSVSLVSENVLHAAGTILVPLIPTTLSVRTLDQLTGFVAGFAGPRPDVLAFFSMVDRRKRLHREIAERLPRERQDIAVTTIPALSIIERMAAERAPVAAFAPRSQAARAYRDLWEEVLKKSAVLAQGGGPDSLGRYERLSVSRCRPLGTTASFGICMGRGQQVRQTCYVSMGYKVVNSQLRSTRAVAQGPSGGAAWPPLGALRAVRRARPAEPGR